MSETRDTSVPPTPNELLMLGFEPWQVSECARLPAALQWEAHDLFIRRLMSNDDVEDLRF